MSFERGIQHADEDDAGMPRQQPILEDEPLGVGRKAEALILRTIAEASIEPWMELSDQLEQRYRIWKFTKLNLQVPDNMQVFQLREVARRFHAAHPEAYAEVVVFDPTVIRIVRYNPLEQR